MENNRPLAVVGTTAITEADITEAILAMGPRGESYNNPQGRAAILDQLINQLFSGSGGGEYCFHIHFLVKIVHQSPDFQTFLMGRGHISAFRQGRNCAVLADHGKPGG